MFNLKLFSKPIIGLTAQALPAKGLSWVRWLVLAVVLGSVSIAPALAWQPTLSDPNTYQQIDYEYMWVGNLGEALGLEACYIQCPNYACSSTGPGFGTIPIGCNNQFETHLAACKLMCPLDFQWIPPATN